MHILLVPFFLELVLRDGNDLLQWLLVRIVSPWLRSNELRFHGIRPQAKFKLETVGARIRSRFGQVIDLQRKR